MGDLRTVSLDLIRENPVALRAVNRKAEEYQGLVQSIRQKGFLGAITVRPRTDADSGQEYFELVDGLHRYSASKDAGLDSINVDVVDLNDDAVLEAQLMANIHRIETRPVEYSQQLRRILARNQFMTEAELASQLGKSSAWISQRLGLNKIENEEITSLINEGKIKLANAYALAKLPTEEMANFVDRAITEKPDVFVPQINARVKEIKEAKRQGKDPKAATFQPVAFLQKLKEVKEEHSSPSAGPTLCAGLSTPEEGFQMACAWFMHLDPQSVAVQQAKDDQRKAERAEAKKKRDAVKAKAKADKASEDAAKLAVAAEEASAALG